MLTKNIFGTRLQSYKKCDKIYLVMKLEYLFTDEQWQQIEKYLPNRKTGRPYKNLRATVNGIYWIIKTGSTWRSLPPCFGKWQEVYQCFARWRKAGFFEDIFAAMVKVTAVSEIGIDSTFAKAHFSDKKKSNRQE